MADIFVSYSNEDRERVIPVVKALEAQGWSVWWDRIIPPGKTFSRVIEEALAAAKCLIVLWTETSVKSDWVNNEAAEGARRRILIPALLDDVGIPFEFKRIQAAALVGWSGESDHAGFQQLIKALTDLLGPPAAKVPVPEPPATSPAKSKPAEFPADAANAAKSPHLGQSEPKPARGKPPGKNSAARITGLIALALTIAAGATVLFKTELFQSPRMQSEDSAARPGLETAAPQVKPDTPDTTRRAPSEPRPELPASEKEAPAPHVKPEPEMPVKPSVAEAKPETPANDSGPSTPRAKPEPQKTLQPAVKESKPEVLAPVPKAPGPPVKPEPQKPARAAVKEPKPEAPASDSIAPAPRVKPEEPATAVKSREASSHKAITNSVGMQFVLIPAPAEPFTMGSRLGTDELIVRFGGTEVFYKVEKPFHPVKIGRAFYLLTTPVTQGQWQRVMGENPSSFKDCGEDCPVEMVSWDDAQRFIARLNQMEGAASYRLPSEAEWEYAGRAGNDTEFFFGNDAGRLGEFAWYSANSNNKTHPVGRKKSNAWGLYDMPGNVWEWVEDDWHATYDGAPADGSAWIDKKRGSARVVRGGGWGVTARYCRLAARYYGNPAARTGHTGFRLVRSVTPGQ